ncbi:TPA: hypothetical protein ACHFPU_004685 [Enterobacter hormaechei]|uniref:hypothetical protein n=1 Tax=Enterobacter TaxID=547 RepID=UPI0007354D15|nr:MULTISPECIES: hypothetical protein [Enterobacter]EHF4951322.1 hypothetical protein [Enterobacter hormaechei]KTH61443.1 hypothetical protein ASV21_07235 [Enterobacter hormaechei subsp. steigerwaltii]KTJ48986.1 hypothetical protein ASU81_13055 [Enterobacter hormaechei subsp. steigerwaltii]KZP96294.1 hypothetical protein A3N35_10740 [Enterobacter hormaechei subsp. steigerwaltii]MBW7608637.1 hypothetical protein [Enterobacter hormaechei]
MILKHWKKHLLLIALFGYIAIKFGALYKYSDIKDVLSTLQNISAMIFTIAGIWLAYIYPKAISAIVKPSTLNREKLGDTSSSNEVVITEKTLTSEEKKSIDKDIKRITMIVETIIVSAFVIFAIVLINAFKPIFSNFDFVKSNLEAFNKIGCFASLSLVYLQLVSLFTIISSNVVFLNDIHNEKNDNELNRLK